MQSFSHEHVTKDLNIWLLLCSVSSSWFGCFRKWWYSQIILFIGFSIINHPFWGTLIFGNTQISLITKKKHKSSASTVTFCSVLCRRLAAEVLQDGVQVPLHHRRFMMNAVLEWLLKLNVYDRFLDIFLWKSLEDDCFRTSWSRKVYSAFSLSLYHWNLTSHFCKMDLSYRDLRAEIAMWATTKITHGWMWRFLGENLAGNHYLVGDCNFLALFFWKKNKFTFQKKIDYKRKKWVFPKIVVPPKWMVYNGKSY